MDPGLRLALVATTGAGKVLLDGQAADGRAVRSWAVLAGWRWNGGMEGVGGDWKSGGRRQLFFLLALGDGLAARDRPACLQFRGGRRTEPLIWRVPERSYFIIPTCGTS